MANLYRFTGRRTGLGRNQNVRSISLRYRLNKQISIVFLKKSNSNRHICNLLLFYDDFFLVWYETRKAGM